MNVQFLTTKPRSVILAQASPASLGLDIQLIAIDETRHWSKDVVQLAGDVFRVYAYDANRVTHCCEVTPSYELYPVVLEASNCPASEDKRERLDEMLRSVQQDPIYMHCRSVDLMSRKFRRPYHVIDRLLDDTYDEQFERVLEEIRCNPPFIAPGRDGCIII